MVANAMAAVLAIRLYHSASFQEKLPQLIEKCARRVGEIDV
jgi:hypothetical protein